MSALAEAFYKSPFVEIAHEHEKLTVNDNIANSISPIFLILGLPIVLAKLASPVADYGIALGENFTIYFDNGYVASGIYVRGCTLSRTVFLLVPLIKGVANILESSACILGFIRQMLQIKNYLGIRGAFGRLRNDRAESPSCDSYNE